MTDFRPKAAMCIRQTIAVVMLFCFMFSYPVYASQTQKRMDKDIAAGRPVVIQLSVALADNKNQWIVPVPAAIGNGQNAGTNLYWGALYGVKTYMIRRAGWKSIALSASHDERILERRILKNNFMRNGRTVQVYLVADAWDGRFIHETIRQFLRYNAGNDAIEIKADGKVLYAGGKAHLVVYIGHNALMDYGGAKTLIFREPPTAKENPVNDAIVLACNSQTYFSSRLKKVAAHPLLLTTGLMAPEAYTLHAAIEKWIAGASDRQIRKAAAGSYHHFQRSGLKAAERLFGVE